MYPTLPLAFEIPPIEENGRILNLRLCDGGDGFSLLISTDTGNLYTIGKSNHYLQLGPQNETEEPVFPSLLPILGSKIVHAAAGNRHAVAVTDSGSVFLWGQLAYMPVIGQPVLIIPNRSNSGATVGWKRKLDETLPLEEAQNIVGSHGIISSVHHHCTWPPILVRFSPGIKIGSVAAGAEHTLALSDNGQVWGWGSNSHGQLGFAAGSSVCDPGLVPCLSSSDSVSTMGDDSEGRPPGLHIISIACGAYHSAAISDAGALLTCGWGLYGQCGHGVTDDCLHMRHVADLGGLQVTRVSAGLWHTAAVTLCGQVFTWGGNQFGQLGLSDSDGAQVRPQLVDCEILQQEHVSDVACGARHTVVATDSGEVYSWGWNKFGQLGLPTSKSFVVAPTRLPTKAGKKSVVCGWWHTIIENS